MTDLFRPFLDSRTHTKLSTFEAAKADAAAAYSASVRQLQRLLVTFRSRHRSNCLSVLWQTPVIYVLNAALREAAASAAAGEPTPSEVAFYIRMSFAALRELAQMYRAFGAVAIGGLGMAWTTRAISRREIGHAMRELLRIQQRELASTASGGDGSTAAVTAMPEPDPQWMLDFDLAVRDPARARGGNVVRVVRDALFKAAAAAAGDDGDEQHSPPSENPGSKDAREPVTTTTIAPNSSSSSLSSLSSPLPALTPHIPSATITMA